MSTANQTHTKSIAASRAGLRQDLTALFQMIRRCSPVVLFAPAAAIGIVLLALRSPWYSLTEKNFQEILAPSVLALAAVPAAGALLQNRLHFLRWQAVFTAALFCRELHFAGTNNGIYVILALLFWYAARRRDRMEPFVRNRTMMSLLFGAMWLYAVAKTFDRGYWHRSLPEIEPIRHALEETLETTGHLLILAMVLVSSRVAAELARTSKAATVPTGGTRHLVPGVSPVDGPPRSGRRKRSIRRFRWGLLLVISAGLLAAGLSLGAKSPEPDPVRRPRQLPFELSSLCPVEAALGPNLFLAGSDEFRTLALWRLDDSGRASFLSDLDLKVPRADGGFYHLDDLEALAADGNGTYYAVSSHRQLDREKDAARLARSNGTERALVSFRLERTGAGVRIVHPRTVCGNLLKMIRRLGVFETVNWRHPESFRWRELARSWQIDIEGLAVAEGRILLGFKNPVEEGRAAILALDPATQELAVVARPDFQGQGILSLCYDRRRDRLVVLTNDPLKGRFADSCLWIGTRTEPGGQWQFPGRPQLILERSAETGRKASGLALDRDRMLVCFDDPREPVIRVFPLPQALGRQPRRHRDTEKK